MQRKTWGGLLALVITGGLSAAAAQQAAVEVSDAWIREVPPGVSMLAGYFTLSNPTASTIVLSGARSPRFGAVEMHHTQISDGVARMRRLEGVTITPGESVEFAPGGRHLMLFDPRDVLAAGDCAVITLLLEGGGEIEARFEVRRP